jgi:hypothetical protein
MSTQITQEQIRQARHTGFVNSLTQHRPKQIVEKLYNSYRPQDARRERNIGNFVGAIRGQG